MTVRVVPFEPRHTPEIAALNRRLAAGDAGHRFPEDYSQVPLQPGPGRPVFQRLFVAEEGPEIRGGYILKHEAYSAWGRLGELGNYQLPLSEGIIDPRFRMVGVQLLKHALRLQPEMYCLGMGGLDLPLARMLISAGWRTNLVPFMFRVVHPQRFLSAETLFPAGTRLGTAARAARLTGTGFVGLKIFQYATETRRDHLMRIDRTSARLAPDFDDWADRIWDECRGSYGFVCERTSATLRLLYPTSDRRFMRVMVTRDGRPIGWCLVMASRMNGHKQFGDLFVGSIVDGMSLPQDAAVVIAHGVRLLERRGVDLIISNQSHAQWRDGLRVAGFLDGPSNYVLAVSPALSDAIGESPTCHVNRGDGPGPLHL